jgi:peptidoglycan/xylan/chitin deacetylase (PgdA/CDA1 family)
MNVHAVIAGLPEERAARAAYVLRTFLSTLGLPHEVARAAADGPPDGAVVAYGPSAPPDAPALVHIACLEPPHAASPIRFAKATDGEERLAFLGESHAVEGRPLYTRESDGQPVVAQDGSRVRLGFDLVASAALWLTGGDEADDCRDELGRPRGAAGPRAEADLTGTPVVTALMRLLGECLDRAAAEAGIARVRLKSWPGGRPLALLLSHDVDRWRKRTTRQFVKELLRSLRRPSRIGQVLRTFASGPDAWALEPIADLEAEHGARSTFFLLPNRADARVGGTRVVNRYPVTEEEVATTARRLSVRGWEIGLHASFQPGQAPDFAAERKHVEHLAGEDVPGVRQHFLVHRGVPTWQAQADAGLRYDASLGYPDADGYRWGFSFPFRPFAGKAPPILELPLVVMDGALLDHQGLDAADAWDRVEQHLLGAERDEAMVSLLWHNTHFCDLDAPGYREVYERALAWAEERGAWATSAQDIVEWWQRRGGARLSVERRGEGTRVAIASDQSVRDLCLEVRLAGAGPPAVRLEHCSGEVLEAEQGRVVVRLEALDGESGAILIGPDG